MPIATDLQKLRDRLAPSDARDELTFMTDAIDLGSVSTRSCVFHAA